MEKDIDVRKLRENNSDVLEMPHTKEVPGVLQCIKIDKSLVPFPMYSWVLKDTREEIAGHLAEIFVSSIARGEVLED